MNMKFCRDFESLLSLFAGDELEVEQTAQVAAHLETCVACREKVAAYKKLASHLSAMSSPVLPDNLFDDFYAGVREKISTGVQVRSRALGLVALLHTLHRHRRLAWMALALVVVITGSALLWTQRFQPASQSNLSLAQLLEKREWGGLYQAMRKNETRLRFLDEPVPAKLLQTALTELVIAQRKDRKLREGLERILMSMPIKPGSISRFGRSAQLLGKITATGYQSAMTARPVQSDPEVLLQNLLQIGTAKTVTLRELLLKTRLL
jgi:Putative zinc-finger